MPAKFDVSARLQELFDIMVVGENNYCTILCCCLCSKSAKT